MSTRTLALLPLLLTFTATATAADLDMPQGLSIANLQSETDVSFCPGHLNALEVKSDGDWKFRGDISTLPAGQHVIFASEACTVQASTAPIDAPTLLTQPAGTFRIMTVEDTFNGLDACGGVNALQVKDGGDWKFFGAASSLGAGEYIAFFPRPCFVDKSGAQISTASWNLFMQNGMSGLIDGDSVLLLDFPNLNLDSVQEVLHDPATYTITMDIQATRQEFSPDEPVSIETTDDGTFPETHSGPESVGIPTNAFSFAFPHKAPFKIRVTFNRRVVLENVDGSPYMIPPGSRRTVMIGGCQLTDLETFMCGPLFTVSHGVVTCNGINYRFDMNDIDRGAATVEIQAHNDATYTVSEGQSVSVDGEYTVSIHNLGTVGGGDVAHLRASCSD